MSGTDRKKYVDSFLEWHYRIYSTVTRGIAIYFYWTLGLIIGFTIYIIVRGEVQSNSAYVLIGVAIDAGISWYIAGQLRTLRASMKKYCKLPMAFAVIPILRARKATDPRDLCYGLYGVLELEGLSHLTLPDYRQDPRIVFREFLLDLLQWDNGALVLLLDCCSFEEPSWSPDWRVTTQQSWLDEGFFYGISDVCATPKSIPYFEITDDRRHMFVYGVNANGARVIWRSADLLPEDATELDWEKGMEKECLDILMDWIRTGLEHSRAIVSVPVEDQVRVFEALEGKLLTNRLFVSYTAQRVLNPLADLSNGFITWFELVKPYLISSESAGQDSLIAAINDESEPRIGCYEKICASPRALDYHRKICHEIVAKRSLFVFSSSKGVRFGTGSRTTEVGDSICLISGLPVPMLLRSGGPRQYVRNGQEGEAEAFTVVGPAFIPSMMRGGMWPKGEKQKPIDRGRLKEFYLI
jgi:hypothetical protein